MSTEAKFKPNELPDSITTTLYVRYHIAGYNAGAFSVWDSPYNQTDTVPICETEITIIIPQDLDIKGLALKSLEDKKAEILAENHQRLKAVQDKIDNLLAIEYKPEAA